MNPTLNATPATLLHVKITSLSNSDQKPRLPFLPICSRPFHKFITHSQPQPLTRRRTIQIPHSILASNTLPMHSPRRHNRLSERKEHSTTQEKRRLANALATLHTS